MKAALLFVGDELLIGQVNNSNAQWISEKLTDLGITVQHHLTVGDSLEEIEHGLKSLVPHHDAVILGGGLGPTHDDMTLEALAKYLGTKLEYDQDWISKVEEYFKSRNRPMSENNKKQAFLIKNANRIDNDCGTAAGQHIKKDSCEIFVVPGVPHEMKSMMERYILPALSKSAIRDHQKILKTTLVTTGMGESALALRLNSTVEKIKSTKGMTLAFLPSTTSVRLRLQMTALTPKDENTFKQLIEELKTGCAEDYLGLDPTTVEEVLIHSLTRHQKTVALAESCTGGLVAHKLTQVPGSSKVFKGALIAYQNEIKTKQLGIDETLIQKNGVVSEAVATAMAENIRKQFNSDFGVATTGFIGDNGGDSFAPAGTVWIAVSSSKETVARKFSYEKHRERDKERATQSALDLLRRQLL